MICPKCRVKIADSDKYCPRCGEIFDHIDLEKLGNKLENELLNIYSNKIWGRLNISLGYLFFNVFYAAYKKMYYEVVIGGIADILFVYLIFYWKKIVFGSMGFYALLVIYLFLITIFVNIYYILKFDELYLIRSKGNISKMINEYGISDVKLLTTLCEKDSKGNLFGVVLSVILLIGIFVYLFLTY